MDQYDLSYARANLAELLDRAARGEEVSIADPTRGTFALRPVSLVGDHVVHPSGPPLLGTWKGRLTEPARLLEPLSDEELEWLAGERSE